MKKRNLVLLLFAFVLSFSSESYSQGFLKKLGKALEDVNKTLDEVNSVVGGTNSKSSDFDSKVVTKDVSVEAFVGDTDLQRGSKPFRLTTNHPDFKIKVRRCEVAGKTCVIDLILENVGYSDIKIYVPSYSCIAYDDEANEYSNIAVAVGGNEWIQNTSRTLLAGVPMKARLQIEGVSEAATVFRRLDWKIQSHDWGLGDKKFVSFVNLPISREGDSF